MRLFHVDAFAHEPFRGNPAAVCFLDRTRDDAWMQSLAAELKLSATAFLLPLDDDTWSLRWNTPSVEIGLCGHGTLASAHTLWEEGVIPRDEVARFQTKSGLLTATRDGDWIELDFPATHAVAEDAPPNLLESLGIASANYVGRNKFDYVVEVATPDEVRALAPDHSRLRTVGARGVIVTSRGHGDAGGEYDFISRFFAPGSGIDEDPVTGSAHCCLTPYWSQRLGKTAMTAYQASARGGVVRVRLEGDRVKLAGQAVTIFRADLRM